MVQVALALPSRCEGPNLTDIIVLGLNHKTFWSRKLCSMNAQMETFKNLNPKGPGSRR